MFNSLLHWSDFILLLYSRQLSYICVFIFVYIALYSNSEQKPKLKDALHQIDRDNHFAYFFV